MMSNRRAALDASTRRKQVADEIETHSEKRKPETMEKKSTEQKFSSPASPKNKSYLDALVGRSTRPKQDAGQVKALSEKGKPMAMAKTLIKPKSLLLANQGATSSSSAPAPPPSASAINLQAEVSVKKVNPCDFANDIDQASHHHKKADTDATTVIDQESVDIALKTKSKPGGNSRKEEEKLKNLEPVNLLDDGKTRLECLGSKSNFSTKFLIECPEKTKVVIKDDNIRPALFAREVFKKYRMTEEGQSVDACIKEKLQESRTAKNENSTR